MRRGFCEDDPGVSTLNKIIKAMIRLLPNLLVHSKDYPTTSYLRSIVATGQTEVGMAEGNGKDPKGSELIINAVDKDDASYMVVYVLVWHEYNCPGFMES